MYSTGCIFYRVGDRSTYDDSHTRPAPLRAALARTMPRRLCGWPASLTPPYAAPFARGCT